MLIRFQRIRVADGARVSRRRLGFGIVRRLGMVAGGLESSQARRDGCAVGLFWGECGVPGAGRTLYDPVAPMVG